MPAGADLTILVVALSATAGGIAYATIPDGGNVYTGCMLKNVGTSCSGDDATGAVVTSRRLPRSSGPPHPCGGVRCRVRKCGSELAQTGLDSVTAEPENPDVGAASLRQATTMAEPTSQPKTRTLECIECQRIWAAPLERWRLYLTEDEPVVVVAYCSVCAQREYG